MVLKSISRPAHQQHFEYEGLYFAQVNRASQLSDPFILDKDGIFVESSRSEEVQQILKQVRGSDNPLLYLKPVFVKSIKLPAHLVALSDGAVNDENLRRVAKKTIGINQQIALVDRQARKSDFKEETLLKAVQFIFTRRQPLKPFRNRKAMCGYLFPFLNAYLPASENLRIIDILEKARKEELLSGKILDKINLCQACDSAFLNFRETCTKCHSIDLVTEDLIHHFRCAYVGPASDFKQGDDLVCPKCDKSLRHIGIDYDKPSEIFNCQTCNHQSQEAPMKAACADCGNEMELSYISSKNIGTYQLTAQGEKLATQGFKNNGIDLNERSLPVGTIGWEFFRIMHQQEKERVRMTGHLSLVGVIQLDTGQFEFLGADSKEKLRQEIVRIVRPYLRSVDVLSSKNFSTYAFLLPETTVPEARQLQETLAFNLQKLIGHNLAIGSKAMQVKLSKINA
ncbi:MAG: hypothetical protein AAFZ15_24035 [Bacteroidota bacterium]